MNLDKKTISIFVAILLGVILTYQNCSPVSFQTVSQSEPSTNSITGGGGGGGGGGTTTTIKNFQPALASRDISCLACHANVGATVITDFGYGNSWYLGQNDSSSELSGFGNDHYFANTWQTIEQINGQVIVPEATVPDNVVDAALLSGTTAPPDPVSLQTYLTMSNVNNYASTNGWYGYFGETAPSNPVAFTYPVNPPSGQSAVVAESNVYIGAPTASEILAIVSNSSAAPWLQAVGASQTGLSGLSVVSGKGGSYISNTGAVQCSGQDVVINGTLLLSSLQIYAEKGGCRLYVNGSVFIIGPITYLNSGSSADPTDNLQITSSVFIGLGVGLSGNVVDGSGGVYSTTPLQNRLTGDVRNNMYLRSAQTDSAYSQFTTNIVNAADVIGSTLLVDAANPGSLPTGSSAAGQKRALINFNHLLLNAPVIHSRYLGVFTGVIVTESALFSLGEFSFAYDPVFESVPVLPALPYDILCAGAADVTCNPAQQ